MGEEEGEEEGDEEGEEEEIALASGAQHSNTSPLFTAHTKVLTLSLHRPYNLPYVGERETIRLKREETTSIHGYIHPHNPFIYHIIH